MPDTNDGPAGTATDTVPQVETGPLPGFAEAMMGFPPETPVSGEPKGESAVETSAEAKAPEPTADTPAPKAEPAKDEAKPDPAKTVNFDGFEGEDKTLWERLFKNGVVSAEEVDKARHRYMFQSSWTKNHQALAKEKAAFKELQEKVKTRLAKIEKIEANPALHAAVDSVLNGEAPAADAAGDDFVSRKEAERIADERAERREKERQERTAKEEAAYSERQQAFQSTIHEQMKLLGVDKPAMVEYLKAEEQDCAGEDPILTLDPMVLAKNLALRHKAATAEKRAAELEQQAAQKTSRQAQASKQSFPPPRSVPVERATRGPLEKYLPEGEKWEDVPGLGWQGNGR